MASTISSSSSRSSTSSPTGSRASTPSSQSSPSEFLPNDISSPVPYSSWSLFPNSQESPDSSGLFGKPSPLSFPGLDITSAYTHASEDRGILLEDIMQEDAYENGPSATNVYHVVQPQQLLTPDFEPHLPHHLPTYQSSLSSSATSSQSHPLHPPTADDLPPSSGASDSMPPNAIRSPTSSGSVSEQSTSMVTHSSAPMSFEAASQNFLVAIPNATCPNTPIVTPLRHTLSNLPILIHNVPNVGAKSRVETQIKMTLDLVLPTYPIPSTYDRVGSWKWLKLPKGTSTRRRPRKEAKPEAYPEDILSLSVTVTCASDPSMPVRACTNCLTREAKRTERKKAARVRPVRRDSSDSEDGDDSNGDGVRGNIVVFNCPDLNDFSEGRVVLPVRVTCYCRHHREKVGFRIAFTMSDCQGRVVGHGSTPPIMITDDHKSVVKSAPGSVSMAVTPTPPPALTIKEEPDEGLLAKRKKRTRDDAVDDARAKRRAKEPSPPLGSCSTTGSPLYQTLANDAGLGGESWSMKGRGSYPPSTFTTAPSSPQIAAIPSPTALGASGRYLQYPISPSSQSEQHRTQIPQIPTSVSTTMDADTFLQSQEDIEVISATLAAAAESHRNTMTSTSATKSILTPSPLEMSMSMSALFNVPTSATAYPSPPSSLAPLPLPPQIHRLIPSSGPTHGGVEVTVLGANFLPTHRCVFGDAVATSTQMWSENTLVCLLPPSAAPGPVVVSFEGIPLNVGGGVGNGAGSGEGGNLPLFNYLDNSDRALMELALQVVGLKMTGRIEEAKNVAMRIVGNSSPRGSDDPLSTGGMSPINNLSVGPSTVARSVHHLPPSASSERSALLAHSSSRDFQSVIIEFLSLLDVNVPTSSAVSVRDAVSHGCPSGQTMLHLSAILGFHRLLRHLIQRGIDVDARDANGYTALHFAALSGRLACARILVEGGADVEIVDARGRTAREIARWRDQIDVELLLQDAEQRAMVAQTAAVFADRSVEEGASEEHEAVEGRTEDGFASEEHVGSEEGSWGGEEDDEVISSPATTIRPSHRDIGDVEELDTCDVSSLSDQKRTLRFRGDEKKPPHPLVPSEKSAQSLFHRTLSHLQPPPLPNLPALPAFPALPNMPGLPMPHWALLPNQLQFPQLGLHMPDIPLVFPVHIPTPSWPTAFQWQVFGGEKMTAQGPDHEQQQQQQRQGPQEGQQTSWGVYGSGSPWFGLYPNRWSPFPTPTTVTKLAEELPQYTPKEEPAVVRTPSATISRCEDRSSPGSSTVTEAECASTASGASTPKGQVAIKNKLARKLGYVPMRVAERETRAQEHHSEKDTMLLLFWIPILLIVIACGLYRGIPIVLTSAQDLAKVVLHNR